MLFDHVDYDGEGEIGFNKFCLFNADRKNELYRLVNKLMLNSFRSRNIKMNKEV